MVAVLVVLGAYAYVTIPASIFPTMSFARIDVVADAGDLPPERVRISVAQPLERAFSGLPGVEQTKSTSAQGSAEVVVTFAPSTNVITDLQYVDQAIAAARTQLPADVSATATVINPNSEPIVSYAFVSSTLSQTVIHEIISLNLVPQLYGTPGLARMLTIGGPQREYLVRLNPAALAANGLSIRNVTDAIAGAATVVSPGIASAYARRNVLVVDSRVSGVASLEAIDVPNGRGDVLPLGALGNVRLSVAPATDVVSFNAKHAVALNFYALPGADTLKMADAVAAKMALLAPHLPVGIRVRKFWDQTTLIRESQASLRDAIALGAFLAIVVILIFLRNLRLTLIAALVIPIAIAITIFAVGLLHQSLNLMSVGALAVAVGLIIDDAIVVIENIARNLHLYPGDLKRAVIAKAMGELVAPMSASTLTTVVVFIPLVLLSGVSGFFFRALAATLGTALVVSLALAILVTPLLALHLIQPASRLRDDVGFTSRVLARYEPLLRWALAHRLPVYLGSAAVLAVTLVLLTRLPSGFLPMLDEGQFEIGYQMPPGTTLAASDAAATALERIALADPSVKTVGRFSGIDTNGFSPTPVRDGTIRIVLQPANRRAGYEEISSRLRDIMQRTVPAATLDFHQILEDMLNDVSGAPAPLQVVIRGADQASLIRAAQAISASISKVSGIEDASPNVQYDDPTLQIVPNGARLASLSATTDDFSAALAASSLGSVAASLATPTMLVPVRVTLGQPAGSVGARLLALPAGVVPLASVARLVPSHLSSDVIEENGQRVAIVTANIGARSLSGIVADMRVAIARTSLPPGTTWSIGGEYRAQQQSFREFAMVIAISIVLVFFVMLATFRSYRLPLVILTAIPLSLIGVALGLFVTRTPFNVSSFMGLLLLVGLIVKNGILLVDIANQRRSQGAPVEDALIEAGRLRLRPIIMTTFAAIGGLLPLAVGLGSGSEMEKPLAIAVIGGLSTATAFTLIAIPVLYAGFAGKENTT